MTRILDKGSFGYLSFYLDCISLCFVVFFKNVRSSSDSTRRTFAKSQLSCVNFRLLSVSWFFFLHSFLLTCLLICFISPFFFISLYFFSLFLFPFLFPNFCLSLSLILCFTDHVTSVSTFFLFFFLLIVPFLFLHSLISFLKVNLILVIIKSQVSSIKSQIKI